MRSARTWSSGSWRWAGLAHPGMGPRRISAELAREKWGGLRMSEHGVWRVLCRIELNTRTRRLALIARHRDPYERVPCPPPPERHIDASEPGSSFRWTASSSGGCRGARVLSGSTRRSTSPRASPGQSFIPQSETRARATVRRCFIASATSSHWPAGSSGPCRPITARNWSRETSGGLWRATAPASAGIKAGRPTSNGCVERVQLTLLEECWRASFARSLVPKITALRRDLQEYLAYYNFDRAHTGRLTRGRVPGEIVYGARKMESCPMSGCHQDLGIGTSLRGSNQRSSETRHQL